LKAEKFVDGVEGGGVFGDDAEAAVTVQGFEAVVHFLLQLL
jgi:hypothetical protein